MKTKTWSEIEDFYKVQIEKNASANGEKLEGLHHVLELIPLLKASNTLSLANRNMGFFSMSFHTSNKTEWIDIVPPSPILTGSTTLFRVIKYGLDTKKNPQVLNEKKIAFSSMSKILETAENFFLQL